jgi:protein-L-isoaspartate(D-aspartate) O-methyltransferase
MPSDDDRHALRRLRMVEEQIVARGVRDEAVLTAMRAVPRHLFVPLGMEHVAYEDCALAIGRGQTISQPFMVALMTELMRLAPDTRVLEIGTGSGYQAAVAAHICAAVWTIERVAELSQRAAATLGRLKVRNVSLVVEDGSRGLPAEAPFGAIVVTAAAPEVPPALLRQLQRGGRLVAPLGPQGGTQVLTVLVREGDAFRREKSVACRFVPLIAGAPAAEGEADYDGEA